MYIKITNENIIEYSIEQLIYDNPNISFPKNISNNILEKFDIYPISIQEKPIINEKTEKIENGGFIQKESGNWIKTWKIVQKSQEETEAWILSKEMEVRNRRNMLLAETDYLALSDNTMTQEMAEYRQNLRDITLQDGFPENVIWPIKPV